MGVSGDRPLLVCLITLSQTSKGEGKGEPWNLHHLTLYCCVDNRLWTEEGIEIVRQEKADEITKFITNMKKKSDLSDTQQAFIQRKQSTLTLINNSFERPSKPLYQSQSHILVGVSLELEKPATVAVVDAIANKVLAYRSIKQLLGDNYQLLNRHRNAASQNFETGWVATTLHVLGGLKVPINQLRRSPSR